MITTGPSDDRASSPEVRRLSPRRDAPKRKQKELIPGIIWIKPEPGTNDVSELYELNDKVILY